MTKTDRIHFRTEFPETLPGDRGTSAAQLDCYEWKLRDRLDDATNAVLDKARYLRDELTRLVEKLEKMDAEAGVSAAGTIGFHLTNSRLQDLHEEVLRVRERGQALSDFGQALGR
jgi:hypothetical protein